jgi:hypothetical protein
MREKKLEAEVAWADHEIVGRKDDDKYMGENSQKFLFWCMESVGYPDEQILFTLGIQFLSKENPQSLNTDCAYAAILMRHDGKWGSERC